MSEVQPKICDLQSVNPFLDLISSRWCRTHKKSFLGKMFVKGLTFSKQRLACTLKWVGL